MKQCGLASRCLPGMLLMTAIAPTALAHGGSPPAPHDLWASWSLEPGVLFGLAGSAILYLRGLRRRRRAAQSRRGLRRWEPALFAGGWLTLGLALVSPLDRLGGSLFSAHMVQHELLMLVAAPLLVLGRPLPVFLLAFSGRRRHQLVKILASAGVWRLWRSLLNPAFAWIIHAAVLWLWHAPFLFQATLSSESVHALQHLSFLFSAIIFCESLIHGRLNSGPAVFYVFTTAIHTSLLGALLTLSPTPWYSAYAVTTATWGLTSLEDQQLGGLIMWIPAGAIYTIAGLALLAVWLRESERRTTRLGSSLIRTKLNL